MIIFVNVNGNEMSFFEKGKSTTILYYFINSFQLSFSYILLFNSKSSRVWIMRSGFQVTLKSKVALGTKAVLLLLTVYEVLYLTSKFQVRLGLKQFKL